MADDGRKPEPADWIEAATGVGPIERARLNPDAHMELLIRANRDFRPWMMPEKRRTR